MAQLGASADIMCDQGWTALTEAVKMQEQSHIDILELLIRQGANVNAINIPRDPNCAATTPLGLAAICNNLKAVKLLVAAGADVNLRNPKDSSIALNEVFSRQGDPEIARFLIIDCHSDIVNPTGQLDRDDTLYKFYVCNGLQLMTFEPGTPEDKIMTGIKDYVRKKGIDCSNAPFIEKIPRH